MARRVIVVPGASISDQPLQTVVWARAGTDAEIHVVAPASNILVFMWIGSRLIEYTACTSSPDGDWMVQQVRNLLMDLDVRGQRPQFLIRDRDKKFSRAFDAVFSGDGVEVIRTPVRVPNANVHIERWVNSVRRECLDRLLLQPPRARGERLEPAVAIRRHDPLGGLIHEYEAAAA